MYLRGSLSLSFSVSSFGGRGTADMEPVEGVWRDDGPSSGLAELGLQAILVDGAGEMRKHERE